MELTQEDILLVLKSVKEELLEEEKAAQEVKKAEASESESSESSDSSPVAKKAEASESCSESSESSSVPAKKAEAEPEAPVDLLETYVGLRSENPEEFKQHYMAATLAAMDNEAERVSAWTSFKSAQEATINKSEDEKAVEQFAKDVAAAKEFSTQVQEQNQKLVEQNKVIQKSLDETLAKFAELQKEFKVLASKPEPAQAASVKAPAPEASVIVKTPHEIVKSLEVISRDPALTDEQRDLVGRYTLRPQMTAELQEFFKKIGSK